MKIGLIADTHIPEAGPELPRQVAQALAGVDLILHAGDLHIFAVLDWLEMLAPVLAVRGNGDMRLPETPRLEETRVLSVEGKRIGLCHRLAFPEEPPLRTLETIMERGFGGRVDVIVHGDTHVAAIETFKGVLLVNPGSPTFPNNLVGMLGTVGMLEICDGQVRPRLIPLDLFGSVPGP